MIKRAIRDKLNSIKLITTVYVHAISELVQSVPKLHRKNTNMTLIYFPVLFKQNLGKKPKESKKNKIIQEHTLIRINFY